MKSLQLIADTINNMTVLIEEYNSCNAISYMRCTSDDERFYLVIDGIQITTGSLTHVYKRVKGICKENGII